jgi:hypothetical protein
VIHIGFGFKTNATVVRTINPVWIEYRPVEFKFNDDGDNSFLTIDFPDPDSQFILRDGLCHSMAAGRLPGG